MNNQTRKVGLGGGCHWCTEGVFQSLKGVRHVDQGWISSEKQYASLSEGVIVHFDEDIISLKTIISIHLLTHSSDNSHSMRHKYRSAVYTFDEDQEGKVKDILKKLKMEYDRQFITQILPFVKFKTNENQYLNYFYKNPNHVFCKRYIHPKLNTLMSPFGDILNEDKLEKARLK